MFFSDHAILKRCAAKAQTAWMKGSFDHDAPLTTALRDAFEYNNEHAALECLVRVLDASPHNFGRLLTVVPDEWLPPLFTRGFVGAERGIKSFSAFIKVGARIMATKNVQEQTIDVGKTIMQRMLSASDFVVADTNYAEIMLLDAHDDMMMRVVLPGFLYRPCLTCYQRLAFIRVMQEIYRRDMHGDAVSRGTEWLIKQLVDCDCFEALAINRTLGNVPSRRLSETLAMFLHHRGITKPSDALAVAYYDILRRWHDSSNPETMLPRADMHATLAIYRGELAAFLSACPNIIVVDRATRSVVRETVVIEWTTADLVKLICRILSHRTVTALALLLPFARHKTTGHGAIDTSVVNVMIEWMRREHLHDNCPKEAVAIEGFLRNAITLTSTYAECK